MVKAIKIYLNKIIAGQKIPFELSDDRDYDVYNDDYFTDRDIAILSERWERMKKLGTTGLEQHDLIEE